MKKLMLFVLIVSLCWSIAAQDRRGGDLEGVPHKHALVMVNLNDAWGPLVNPINDGNDMKDALEYLGFTVEIVTNGSRQRMEDAVTNLKRRLSASQNSYGFFYYAGHGEQLNEQFYMIPSNVNFSNMNLLRDMAFSLQFVLAELEDANNVLNVIVLDACRTDRSRGAFTVTHQPRGSIIAYATRSGGTADDAIGERNGRYTGQLLRHIRTPGIEVSELFRRTAESVQMISNQTSERRITFSGLAYLGSRPNNVPVPPPPPPPRDLYDHLVNATGSTTITVMQDTTLSSVAISKASSITLRGDTAGRTVSNYDTNTKITVERGVTLILENITLNRIHVVVNAGGIFVMNNASIITGSGVEVYGTFTMNEGSISGVISSGVSVRDGIFTMNGGRIANNNGSGGVHISDKGTFNMKNGNIENNTSIITGSGGVWVSGNFNMSGGSISNNRTNGDGGGVCVYGSFNMSGGTISGNRASGNGGGVFVAYSSTIRKTGGTIYGPSASSGYANMAKKGDAVYIDKLFISRTFNRTLGSSDNLYF